MTNQTIEQAVEEVFQEVMSDVGKYYRVSDSLSDILSDSLGERLTKALQAQRDAGAKAVIQELRDLFKDTCEIGTNHLNSELDRLENK